MEGKNGDEINLDEKVKRFRCTEKHTNTNE
jgi:hypothetical protein